MHDPASWISSAISREATGDYGDTKLEPILAALNQLGPVPQPITIAGTKGKGSTVRLLETMLLAHDCQTVAFTSPHVWDLRERWRIDGLPITDADWCAAAAAAATAERAADIELTYFERCFLIACAIAQARPNAHFLCEVGLGGRLDCANALDARLVILTHLSLDHCDVLGDTLEAIAGEKLGVTRADAPLLIAPQTAAGRAAINARVPSDIQATWTEPVDWPCGLPGDHQLGNLGAAWAAVQRCLPNPQPELAQRAAATASLAARCQVITTPNRRALIDGAHNPPSIAATLRVAGTCLHDEWWLIVGLATDKDATAVCAEINHPPSRILRCGYAGARARRAANWPDEAQTWPWHDTIADAIASIPKHADICITGSFYLAGEALEHVGQAGSVPG